MYVFLSIKILFNFSWRIIALSYFIQFSSVTELCPTLCDSMNCSTPGLSITNSRVYSNSCPLSQWCHPTISSSVAPFFCLQSSSIRVFSNELVLRIRWPRYWSFSTNPFNEYSGLISFRIDWFALLAVQGTQESSSAPQFKTSVLWHSAFFMAQLSHPYMTTGKIIALTRQTYVGKVVSLLFNTLSMFIIAFLPRSKHLLISWLQLPSIGNLS